MMLAIRWLLTKTIISISLGALCLPIFQCPVRVGKKQLGGGTDGFVYYYVAENGQTILSSTYQGFANYDQIYFVEVNKKEEVMVLGQAENSQSNFIQNAAYNKPNGGQFITKFNKDLSAWIWSTSFGRGLGVTDISPTAFLADVCNSIYVSGWGSAGRQQHSAGHRRHYRAWM
jgi:hypothetical protein